MQHFQGSMDSLCGETQRGIRRSHDAQGEAVLLVFAIKQSLWVSSSSVCVAVQTDRAARSSANWASGWWTACIDCLDDPFFWDLLTPPPGPLGLLLLLLPVVEVQPRSCKCLRCSGTLQKFKPCLKNSANDGSLKCRMTLTPLFSCLLSLLLLLPSWANR